MKRIAQLIIFICTLWIVPVLSHAATPPCSGNTAPSQQSTDPACWTSSTTTYDYNCTITDAGSGSYYACDNSYQTTDPSTGTNCKPYLSALYDTCGGYWGCSNRTDVKAGDVLTYTGSTTTYKCYYMTATSWSECDAANGTQVPTEVTWTNTSGKACTNQTFVTTRTCPVCGVANNVGIATKPTTNLCAFGKPSAVSLVKGSWTWTCTDSTTKAFVNCSAPNSVDGICNTAATGSYNWYDTTFRAALCSSGTPTINASTSFPVCGATVTWGCNGIGTGKSTAVNACTATRELNPSCACGSANDTTSLNKPTSNLCATGNASAVTGNNGTWSWTCGTPYTFNGNATLTCRDQKSCTAECVSIDLDMPTQIYVSDEGDTIDAKIVINNCSAASNRSCTINGTGVSFSGSSCTSNTVSLPFAGSSMTVNAKCTMNVTCGGGSGGIEKTLTKSATVYGMCAEHSCSNQGICQATPKAAASPSVCHSTCSTDADCSRGRMIETRP